MDPDTADALEQSIVKWAQNAEVETPDAARIFDDSCALCHLHADDGCVECPVMRASTRPLCSGTPWQRAAIALDEWNDRSFDTGRRDAFRAAARAEVEFLKSLREPVAVEDAA